MLDNCRTKMPTHINEASNIEHGARTQHTASHAQTKYINRVFTDRKTTVNRLHGRAEPRLTSSSAVTNRFLASSTNMCMWEKKKRKKSIGDWAVLVFTYNEIKLKIITERGAFAYMDHVKIQSISYSRFYSAIKSK